MIKMGKKENEKYKHKDEDAWLQDNPGKEFKPFDPERKIRDYSEKRCVSNVSPTQSLKRSNGKNNKILD